MDKETQWVLQALIETHPDPVAIREHLETFVQVAAEASDHKLAKKLDEWVKIAAESEMCR